MIKIGVLSDTHLAGPTDYFRAQVEACFAGVDIILHAGDLTELSVLDVFAGRQVHAVRGNMCSAAVYAALPEKKTIRAGRFTIGLIHGAGYGCNNIEDRLWHEFDAVDCIVYGHTHRPVCHKSGPVLFINPGSFTRAGRYGAAGSYAVLEIDTALRGRIYEVGETA